MGESFRDPTDLQKSKSTEIPLGRLLMYAKRQPGSDQSLNFILRLEAAAGTKCKRSAREFRRTGPRGLDPFRSLSLPLNFGSQVSGAGTMLPVLIIGCASRNRDNLGWATSKCEFRGLLSGLFRCGSPEVRGRC